MRHVSALTLVATILVGGGAASAEELLVRGMGRTVGWVVATADGTLAFRDCAGQVVEIKDGRVDRTTGRCPSRGASVAARGVVRSLDPGTKVMVIEDEVGDLQGFYVGKIADAASIDNLSSGAEVEVSGPVAGRAAEIVER